MPRKGEWKGFWKYGEVKKVKGKGEIIKYKSATSNNITEGHTDTERVDKSTETHSYSVAWLLKV